MTAGVSGGFYGKDSVFVKLPSNTNQTYTKKYITSVAVINERRLELSFEGVRWFDLVSASQSYAALKSVGMLPYMTVFPLRLSQIQLVNNPALYPQNEGYN